MIQFAKENAKELEEAIGGLIPRDDQIDTAADILQWLTQESEKGKVVECPTGCGKSLIAQMVIHWLVKNTDLKIAFLVSRKELLEQTRVAMIKSFGPSSVNITQGTKHENRQAARVRVMMEQTIASKIRSNSSRPVIRSIEESDIVFIDECHHTFYQSFIDRVLETGGRVIGLSATPDDWRLLEWFEQEKILGPPQLDLENASPRILATPIVLSYTGEKAAERALIGVEGEEARTKVRFGLIIRTIVDEINQAEKHIEEMRAGSGLPALKRELRWMVKVTRRIHAKDLARHLDSHGIPAKAFVSGKDGGTKREIDAIFAGTSKYRVAVCVQRFSVGYDAPGIQGLILTNETQYPSFVQTVGRVLRTGYPPVKEYAYILDMGGNWKVHKNKYCDRREDPDPIIPIKEDKEQKKGLPRPDGPGRPDAEELGDMVVLTLPGIAKTEFGRMDKSVLFAYCVVEAFEHIQSDRYREYNQLTSEEQEKANALNRALKNYWFITGQNIIPYTAGHHRKREMANAIIKDNSESNKIWSVKASMPDPVKKRLLKARRKYSKQKRSTMTT